ncbi:(2Fe-2S)-binding protein [Mycobacterium sp. ACS4331]|uniref:(2Fe-2S)-binding protein n=1 Tax=Mycobacterium sp. ACS4331 TaxID=1834121 RepID=UPI0009EE62DB|nr:(2Fe-2S)-binding protein [Mycobacterium sp. ACS4331]
MYVCLCVGVTSHTVADAVAAGACTTNDVAQRCGAGADCGRCRRSIRAIIDSADSSADLCDPPVRPGRRPR